MKQFGSILNCFGTPYSLWIIVFCLLFCQSFTRPIVLPSKDFVEILDSIAIPPDLAYYEVSACDIEEQSEFIYFFQYWVILVQEDLEGQASGMENIIITNNSGDIILPDFCFGPSIDVIWTIEQGEETKILEGTFKVVPPNPINLYNPPGLSINPIDISIYYEDLEPQAAIDLFISHWVEDLTDYHLEYLSGGCSPIVTNDYAGQSVSFCEGGYIGFTWIFEDVCFTQDINSGIDIAPGSYLPSYGRGRPIKDRTITACRFESNDINYSQQSLDQDISDWLNASTDEIRDGFGNYRFSEVVLEEGNYNLNICEGGSFTAYWTIMDYCDTISVDATYTLLRSEISVHSPPESISYDACDFYSDDLGVSQEWVEMAIGAWVNTQFSNLIGSAIGGCGFMVITDYLPQQIELCDGGNITVTYIIRDMCETLTFESTFTLIPPDPISASPLPVEAWSACDFSDQDAFEEALEGLIAQTQNEIESEVEGGCNPIIFNDFNELTVPDLPTGGLLQVTWTFDDLCETIQYIQEVLLDPCTSVNELSQADLVVIYPNPAADAIFISFERGCFHPLMAKVYNVLGVLEKELEVESPNNGFSIQTKTFEPGIYFLRLQTKDFVTVRKFLIQ